MTDQIFFDTDCLASFLWVGHENIITQLYRGRIILPAQIYDELIRVPQLKTKIEKLIASDVIALFSIQVGSPEADLYIKLTTNPDPGFRIIGKGEASAITLVKSNNGILGSNNMRDILPYIKLFQLKHTTTSLILVEALTAGLISEGQGNVIWRDMINKDRKLPATTFTNFLAKSQ